jgi:hypothetical protein
LTRISTIHTNLSAIFGPSDISFEILKMTSCFKCFSRRKEAPEKTEEEKKEEKYIPPPPLIGPMLPGPRPHPADVVSWRNTLAAKQAPIEPDELLVKDHTQINRKDWVQIYLRGAIGRAKKPKLDQLDRNKWSCHPSLQLRPPTPPVKEKPSYRMPLAPVKWPHSFKMALWSVPAAMPGREVQTQWTQQVVHPVDLAQHVDGYSKLDWNKSHGAPFDVIEYIMDKAREEKLEKKYGGKRPYHYGVSIPNNDKRYYSLIPPRLKHPRIYADMANMWSPELYEWPKQHDPLGAY